MLNLIFSALTRRLGGVLPIAIGAALSTITAFVGAQPSPVATSAPVYVVPTVEGLQLCDEAARDNKILSIDEAYAYCRKRGLDGSAALMRLLDSLEPGGAAGKVQVGYTLTLQLLSLHKKTDDGWALDVPQLDALLGLVAKVQRPVVIYLAADHFDTIGPLASELRADKRNLMLMRDGVPAVSEYFGYPILPYTLQTDPSIPVNRYRFAALKSIAQRIAALPPSARERIVAITLLGELHQMFPNFESGMGSYGNIRVTDYSPGSVLEFRQWLRRRYVNIEKFQSATGLAYTDFASVPAPSRDIRTEKLASFGEHYDAYAGGTLPIAGWLWNPQAQIQRLDLYIDGKRVQSVSSGLNRLDVYRADESVLSPNVGYRVDYDFSKLTAGRHLAQIIAVGGKNRYRLAEVEFVVVAPDQARISEKPPSAVSGLRDIKELTGVRTWLDMPRQLQDVYFNPLARDWNLFRAAQVRHFLENFRRLAVEAGLPSEKLYSHQIVPNVNSSWNPQLFAADDTLAGDVPWKQGINMYGGATDSDWMRDFVAQRGYRDYGAPEFHPQQWKREGVALQALEAHRKAGAHFISPYYFSTIPMRFRAPGIHGVNRMEIRPDNALDGSDKFYEAIRTFSKQ